MHLLKLHRPATQSREQQPILVNPLNIAYIEPHHETGSYIHFNVADDKTVKYIHVIESIHTIERLMNP